MSAGQSVPSGDGLRPDVVPDCRPVLIFLEISENAIILPGVPDMEPELMHLRACIIPSLTGWQKLPGPLSVKYSK